MSAAAHVFHGRCHCGNLEIRLETDKAAAGLPTRACRCGFCVRHGACTVRDPAGQAIITLNDPHEIRFYRFALRTADFLVCRMCGVYGAAVLEHDGSHFTTLNVNLFGEREAFPPPVPADYGGEKEAERRARRAARWTPARVIYGK